MYHTPHKKKKYFRRELSVIIFLYKSKAFLCCFFKNSFIYLCIIFGCAESPLLCGLFPFVASGGRSVVAVASLVEGGLRGMPHQHVFLVEGGLRGMPHQHVFSCGGRAPRHAASARVHWWRAGSEACRHQHVRHVDSVALRYVGSSQIRGQTRVSCIGRWILHH